TFTNSTDAIPYLGGHGKVHTIAVTPTPPASFAPKLPSAAAPVPGYNVLIWGRFLAPTRTPASVVNKMSEALVAMTKDEKSVAALSRVGSEAFGTTPQQCREFAKQDIDQWVGLMREINYKP